jgi:thymidine phosphorylase
MEDRQLLPKAKFTTEISSKTSGYVTAIACEQIGTASVLLGGGREKVEDRVDPAVGIMVHKKLGDPVSAGDSLCTIHYNSQERLERATPFLEESYTISAARPTEERKLVYRVIGDTSASQSPAQPLVTTP